MRGTWTGYGYDDVTLGAGVTTTRRGGDGETFTPSPPAATAPGPNCITSGSSSVCCHVGWLASMNGIIVQCCTTAYGCVNIGNDWPILCPQGKVPDPRGTGQCVDPSTISATTTCPAGTHHDAATGYCCDDVTLVCGP